MSCGRVLTALLALAGLLLLPVASHAQSLSRWFLAEGANNAVFSGEILVGNPSTQALDVTVRLLPQPDAVVAQPLTRTFPVPATSRRTIRLGADFGLDGSASAEVTAVVSGTSTPADIVVERSMYLAAGPRGGGHNASGVTRLASTWILAEGATTFFDTFVLVANPNAGVTRVRATYLTAGGSEFVTTQNAAAQGRATFWPRNEHPALASAEFSTVIESMTPGHDVVAERAMYFDYPGPHAFARAGHDAVGVSAPSSTWYFAEGYTGGNASIAFETFLLLANQDNTDATVTVTYHLDTGAALSRDYVVPARQRFTVWVDQEGRLYDPLLENAAFGITVQATHPIVAERAMYWGTPSASDPLTPQFPWVEGHATAGTPERASTWGFAEGAQDYIDGTGNRYQTFLLLANPNPAPIVVRATFLREEDGTGIQRDTCVPGNGRANVWTADFPELSNRRFATFVQTIATAADDDDAVCRGVATTGGEEFVAERAMYWGDGFTGGHVNMGTPWTTPIAVPPVPVDVIAASVAVPFTGRLSGGEWVQIDVANVAVTGLQVIIDGRLSPVVEFLSPTRIRARTPVRTADTGYGTGGTKAVVVNNRGQSTGAGVVRFTFRVLAIGDSFTAGEIVERNLLVTPPTEVRYSASPPYPDGMRGYLSGDGQLGSGVTVWNEGYGGECASVRGCGGNPTSGTSRIEGLVNAMPWDAVVIMEGFNDLNQGQQTLGSAVNALRFMGQTARASGATVVMGILEPPMNTLAGAIASMADQEGFARHSFRDVEIGNDDVHPTQEGYDQMAADLYQKLKALFPQ